MRGPSGRESRRGPTGHVGQAAPAIDRALAVSPPIQAVVRTHPDTAVLRGYDGRNGVARQALLGGDRGHGVVAKGGGAIDRRYPDTAFMILEHGGDRIARESVGSVEEIDSSLVDMHEPAVHDGSDPKGAMAVAKQAAGLERKRRRKRKGLDPPVPELADSAVLGNQYPAVIALDQRVDSLLGIGHRIDPGRAGLPCPQASHRSRPETAPVVLIQRGHSGAETAVLSVALGLAALDPAKSSHGRPRASCPERSFAVLEQRFDTLAVKLRVASQPVVFPACKPSSGPDPKTTVARGTQTPDVAARQIRPVWWQPRDAPHSIEPTQAGIGADPEITTGCLRDGKDDALEEPVSDLPCGVRILADVESRVEREGAQR